LNSLLMGDVSRSAHRGEYLVEEPGEFVDVERTRLVHIVLIEGLVNVGLDLVIVDLSHLKLEIDFKSFLCGRI